MRRFLYHALLLLGLPIGLMCVLSLPLIHLGLVRPDPSPWNWGTVYLVDFAYGLTLLTQLAGLRRRASWGRSLSLVVGGYSVFAFAQAALECLLDMAGIQDAPIAQPAFIFTFMSLGLTLGILTITFAIRYPDHWRASVRPLRLVSGGNI